MSRLYNIINKMADNMGSLLVVTQESLTQSAAASSGTGYSINVTKTGYMPIAICGYQIAGAASGSADVRQYRMNSSSPGTGVAFLYVYNWATSAQSWTVTAHVLWLKV